MHLHDAPQVVRDSLDEGNFLVPPPGTLRIALNSKRARVFLDRVDFLLDRPVFEIDYSSSSFIVERNMRLRGGQWVTEFVGTSPPDRPDLLRRCIGMALTGTSRLPIASIETPHPVFALGMLAYLPQSDDSPGARARRLEAQLRAGTALERRPDDLPQVVKTLFNLLALSPHGPLADRFVALVRSMERSRTLELLGYMLRHLARHLNAYDLVRFHNQGANYPDALLLDMAFRSFVALLQGDEDQLLRRALRQGYLARKRCEGLRVPDVPTSPGDNVRELPSAPVPAIQLTDPNSRSLRLFTDDPTDALLTPTAKTLLAQAIDDLSDPRELHELGTATFLDRPLGVAKPTGEPDRTVLLSYEAVGPRLIRSNLALLGVLKEPGPIPGFSIARLPGHSREGVVSLADAKKVALDFIFTRTTRSSLNELLEQYDFSPVADRWPGVYRMMTSGRVLLIRTDRSLMTVFDGAMTPQCELLISEPASYIEQGGIEYLETLVCRVEDQTVALPPRI